MESNEPYNSLCEFDKPDEARRRNAARKRHAEEVKLSGAGVPAKTAARMALWRSLPGGTVRLRL